MQGKGGEGNQEVEAQSVTVKRGDEVQKEPEFGSL